MIADDDDLDIDHPSEIAALLDELVAGPRLLELQAPNGQSLALQTLRLARDDGLLWLRLPGLSADDLPGWLLQGDVHAHALLDRVRIDFELGRRDLGSDGGLPALRLALPTRLRRHQRRQAFRVPALSQHHPRALLAHDTALRLPALDISAGGVALVWPADRPAPVPGELLPGVELELERELRVKVQLRVSHQRRREDGSAVLGCAFEALAPASERVLQQQLQKLQRRARLVGR